MRKFENLIKLAGIEVCFCLSDLGVYEFAFPLDQAIKMVNFLNQKNIAILGGDVYYRKGFEINPSDESWYCEKNNEETDYDFTQRSFYVAITYIESFLTNENSGNILFTITIQDENLTI